MSAARILAAYRAIFGTLIVVASIQTLVAAPAHHVALLAAVEIAGALMLMWRRTHRCSRPSRESIRRGSCNSPPAP